MILNKKLKYILGSVGLLSFVILPASLSLTSCSKKSDKIDYYKQADDAIFEGNYMGKVASTFMCDFNLTKKTCAIVDWVGNYPNYFTSGLENRDGDGNDNNFDNANNTVRIPSQVVYNGEIYTVIAFRSLKGATTDFKLSLNQINNYLIQVLEFDTGLTQLVENVSIDNEGLSIHFEAIRQPNLLKALNYPYVGMNLSGSSKLEEITFNSVKAAYPGLVNCTSLTTINIPLGRKLIGNFEGCTKLKTVTIGEGAEEITLGAFKDCTSLESITLPEGLTAIWDCAFENCTSLKSITIPESVTRFGTWIFDVGFPTTGDHPEGFKIYFHSQEQLDLFLKTNNGEEYCEVLKN